MLSKNVRLGFRARRVAAHRKTSVGICSLRGGHQRARKTQAKNRQARTIRRAKRTCAGGNAQAVKWRDPAVGPSQRTKATADLTMPSSPRPGFRPAGPDRAAQSWCRQGRHTILDCTSGRMAGRRPTARPGRTNDDGMRRVIRARGGRSEPPPPVRARLPARERDAHNSRRRHGPPKRRR